MSECGEDHGTDGQNASRDIDEPKNTANPQTSRPQNLASNDGSGDSKMSWQEKLRQAKSYKEIGNEKYKCKEYKQAIGKYHRALLFVKGIEESSRGSGNPMLDAVRPQTNVPEDVLKEVCSLKMDCYNNLAACILGSAQPAYPRIVQYCDNVLELNPDNVKALYRKGVALYHLKDPDGALEALHKASRHPQGAKDANVKKYIQLCEHEEAKQLQKMKNVYRGMFDNPSSSTPPSSSSSSSEAMPPVVC